MAFCSCNSGREPTKGIITSGNGFLPSRRSSHAASKIACACISVISGKEIPKRQPRWPNIGLNSCNTFTLSRRTSTATPMTCASSTISSSCFGKNSCSGGSRVRIVTGKLPMISRIPLKSSFCIGRSLANARRRPVSSSARIISRTA